MTYSDVARWARWVVERRRVDVRLDWSAEEFARVVGAAIGHIT